MRETLDILVVDDDRKTAERLTSFLKQKEDIHQADQAQDADEAMGLMELTPYDVVVLDLVMAPCDGFGFLERLSHMRAENHPDAIVVSAINSEEVIRKCFSMGAKYYMIKPFQEEIVYRRIWDVMRMGRPDVQTGGSFVSERIDPEQQIADLFLMLGVPPHLKGYQYLKEAVRLAMKDRMIIYSITKRLYPAVAEKFGVTPTKVELAIRHTIEVMWNRGNLKDLGHTMGFRVGANIQKPTNGELIALIADKLTSRV